ncbi:glutathione S-transferase family protein [Acuticoccus sp. I52.16.1]|uniref:glutathione S-transferase family protein n=1 Tax=Acuticoccus sp. I52.16.1 TaxID=2928472 RepID=UPI001FD3A318|nr:glutathione S-transferase family protein [Acuticoccus sp. I52.16.1]UOM35573.1 glutathione S-transferase family protein [Acuticoccus sp. I52.16.1]
MITIHGMTDSGNCYKPRLLAALLEIPFRHNEVSFLDGGTRDPAFLAKTPNGKVPLLELEDGRTLPESNAILCYLAEGSRFVPADRFARAQMMSWLFFEQYSHEPHVAVRRSLVVYPQLAASATPERMAATLAGGRKALAVMEARLAVAHWLVDDAPTLADIALYAYTHLAPEGGFDLAETPGIARWLARVAALPRHRPLDWTPAG